MFGGRYRFLDLAKLTPCGLELGYRHGWLPAVFLYYLVAIPQCPARADNDLNASIFGCLGDDTVSFTGIAVGVLLKDNVCDFPSLEEFWKQSLWCFSKYKEL
jgi:hypothetical protein